MAMLFCSKLFSVNVSTDAQRKPTVRAMTAVVLPPVEKATVRAMAAVRPPMPTVVEPVEDDDPTFVFDRNDIGNMCAVERRAK